MRAFIYAGGRVYDEALTLFPEKEDLVISADSGYLTACRLGVKTDLLLGDFDSLGEPKDLPPHVECLRVPAEKDDTDTQLAVSVALQRGADEIVIVAGLEGRVDHTLSLLAIAEDLWEMRDKKKKRPRRIPCIITNGKNRVRFVRNSGVILLREQYRYFSVLAADERLRGVSLEGCKYPLKNATVLRTRQWAVSNEIVGNCALIEIRKGGAWIVESMD